ncbi:PEP/pyruvate-binding domain-containing protein [Escherichia coli]
MCLLYCLNDPAISYRVHQGYDHKGVALSAGVQRMVRSDSAASGVMFTLDTESGFNDVALFTGAQGLGEMVVQGAVNPDEFDAQSPTLRGGASCRGAQDPRLQTYQDDLLGRCRSWPSGEDCRPRTERPSATASVSRMPR